MPRFSAINIFSGRVVMEREKLNSMEKILIILSSFSAKNVPVGSTELAETLNLTKSTINRNLKILERYGYLKQDPLTKKYSLGPMIAQLWKAVTADIEGQSIVLAQSYCDRLRDRIAETVHFELLSGGSMFLAYSARCHDPVSVSIAVGDRVSLHTHVGAKCIAAYSDPHIVKKWLAEVVADEMKIEELLAEYRQIELRGLSIDKGQFDKNIFAIAVPVFDRNCRAIGSIVALTPIMRKDRLLKKTVLDSLYQAAGDMTSSLMCPVPYDDLCNADYGIGNWTSSGVSDSLQQMLTRFNNLSKYSSL